MPTATPLAPSARRQIVTRLASAIRRHGHPSNAAPPVVGDASVQLPGAPLEILVSLDAEATQLATSIRPADPSHTLGGKLALLPPTTHPDAADRWRVLSRVYAPLTPDKVEAHLKRVCALLDQVRCEIRAEP